MDNEYQQETYTKYTYKLCAASTAEHRPWDLKGHMMSPAGQQVLLTSCRFLAIAIILLAPRGVARGRTASSFEYDYCCSILVVWGIFFEKRPTLAQTGHLLSCSCSRPFGGYLLSLARRNEGRDSSFTLPRQGDWFSVRFPPGLRPFQGLLSCSYALCCRKASTAL